MTFAPTLDVVALAVMLLGAFAWVVRLEVRVQDFDKRADGYDARLDSQEDATDRKIRAEVTHVYRSLDDIKRTLERMETKLDGKADK